MKVYNKFVESKKEPYNKNDIWFDGKVFKVYKEGEWQAITLELEAADKIYKIIKDISNVYQEKLTAGDGISIKNNTISLETFYQIVDSLPKTGKTNTIYLVNSKDVELNNKLVEYIWINNAWEKLGEHKTEIKIPTPDWNAKEGEDGFIKNKPFRFITVDGYEYKFKNSLRVEDFIPIYNEYNEIFLYKKPIDASGLQHVVCNKQVSSHGNIYETLFYPVPSENGKHVVSLEEYSGYVYTEVDDEGYYYLIVEMELSGTFFPENSVYIIDNYEDTVTVEMLPEAFLPPITLKTTKQYLSSKDKKQVLTNLDLVDVARQKDVDKLNEETTALWKDLKEGYHPNSTVGFSDDLVGRGESVPAEFSFRASGGKSIKDGAARIKRIKGNSVVWNNMVDTRGYEGEFIIQGGVTIIAGHKYLLQREKANGYLHLIPVVDGMENYDMILLQGEYGKIYTSQYTDTTDAIVYGTTNMGGCIVSDLTHMFGAGNEPTTIEEYNARKPIVEDEYAFNEGEVIHMTAEGVKSVGDNAWDEEWENGGIDPTNGNLYGTTDHFRNKGYMRILPNTQYYFKKPIGIVTYLFFYDEDKNFVKWLDPFDTIGDGGVFTTYNAPYLRFVCYESTYKNDITISLYHSGWKQDTDAKYQPYWEDRLMFDQRIKDEFPDGMSKWDAVYNKNGKGYIAKGTGVVKIKDLSIRRDAEGVFIASSLPFVPKVDNNGYSTSLILARFTPNLSAYAYNLDIDNRACIVGGNLWMNGQDLSAYANAQDFVNEYGEDVLYYALAEPTIIEYDEPFNLDYEVADFGTEEIIISKPSAPIKADIIYQFNAVDMIREHELEITELQKKVNEGNNNHSNVTPDWNAQEGEAGYIENKPCYVNLNNGSRLTLDNADITLSTDQKWYEKIIFQLNQSSVISLYFYDFNEELRHYVLTEGQSVQDSYFGCTFTAVLNEYDCYDLLLTDFSDPKEYVDNAFAETKIVYEYNDEIIEKLNSIYLPNTVLKTTPQTLSNSAKNQALTNLGIDPVVLKYIINPFVLQTGRIVPDELIASDGVSFKYPYAGMYRWAKGYAYDKDNFEYYNSGNGDFGSVHCPYGSMDYRDGSIYGAGNEIPPEGLPTSSSDLDNPDGPYGIYHDNCNDYFTTGVWLINKDTKQCYLTV